MSPDDGPAIGPAAVLIDLDGTLTDTVDVWRDAYVRLADELGIALPDGFWAQIVGRSLHASLHVFGSVATDDDRGDDASATRTRDALLARLVDLAVDGVTAATARSPGAWHWLPGARELLLTLRDGREADGDGPASALVTSSGRRFAVALLASSSAGDGWPERAFDVTVCDEDVAQGKPAPDGYLRAAELLGVDPGHCLVIEDSATGVAAAEAAGMVVLAVPRAGPIDPAPGRAVRDDLIGLTRADLAALHARLRSGASA
jgi:beta-phosphoglucomutase-like phosphatase (HAD superfamily)